MHRIHHSVVFEQANSNFSAVFPVWDRLFGTYASIPHREHDRLVFGVSELPRGEACRPLAMLMTPLRLSPTQSPGAGGSGPGARANNP
jgi:hypothetical protein